MTARRSTARDRALLALIDGLIEQTENLACNCPDEDTRERLHYPPGATDAERYRLDSPCQGLALAASNRESLRRALRRSAAPGS